MPRPRTIADVDALRAEVAGLRQTVSVLVAELAAVRRLLHTAGIGASEPVPEGFVKLSDYAALHHRSYDAIRTRVRRGQLESVKVGGVRFVKMTG